MSDITADMTQGDNKGIRNLLLTHDLMTFEDFKKGTHVMTVLPLKC